MSNTEKHIINTYLRLFESLGSISKLELLKKFAKSIQNETKSKESDFFSSFGAFASEKSAEEIVNEIKSSRHFREKEIKL